MYHLASTEKRSSITERGLLAEMDSTGYGAIFLADAMPVEPSGFDIWVVDVSGLELEKDFTGEADVGRWWMHYGDIPSDRLTLSWLMLSPNNSPSMF